MRRFLMIGLTLSLAGCERTTDDWIRQLNDADVVKRREAIRELGSSPVRAARAVSALSACLGDENHYVRRDAALALGKFGPDAREAVPLLLAARRDKERSVRKAVQEALKRIDPDTAAKAALHAH
jgi:HEAT repeat protein